MAQKIYSIYHQAWRRIQRYSVQRRAGRAFYYGAEATRYREQRGADSSRLAWEQGRYVS